MKVLGSVPSIRGAIVEMSEREMQTLNMLYEAVNGGQELAYESDQIGYRAFELIRELADSIGKRQSLEVNVRRIIELSEGPTP